jgi:uncharacterized membrane protein YecN with MAPEG domain
LLHFELDTRRSRRKNKVVFADGGVSELTIARSAHANATEYIPITLLLMFGVESNGGYSVLIHVFGIAFVLGRVIHARGILKEDIKKRVLGGRPRMEGVARGSDFESDFFMI